MDKIVELVESYKGTELTRIEYIELQEIFNSVSLGVGEVLLIGLIMLVVGIYAGVLFEKY